MLKGFKTIVFNLIMTGAMVARLWGAEIDIDAEQLAGHLDALSLGIAFLWGAGNMLIRAVTDSPIFNRKKEAGTGGGTNVLLVLLCVPLLLMACGPHSTYTAQVQEQGGSAMQVATAAYADALKWYNDHQEAFTAHVRGLPADALQDPSVAKRIFQINDLLVAAGRVLDNWRLATTLTGMDTASAEWRQARDALIDAGVLLLVKR